MLNSLEKLANHNSFEYAIKVSVNNYGYDEKATYYGNTIVLCALHDRVTK
ncbi:MAG: hypothetical protein ACI4P1_01680 [Erysipelotrichaceae bacterium]